MNGDGRCFVLFFDNYYWKNYACNKTKDFTPPFMFFCHARFGGFQKIISPDICLDPK